VCRHADEPRGRESGRGHTAMGAQRAPAQGAAGGCARAEGRRPPRALCAALRARCSCERPDWRARARRATHAGAALAEDGPGGLRRPICGAPPREHGAQVEHCEEKLQPGMARGLCLQRQRRGAGRPGAHAVRLGPDVEGRRDWMRAHRGSVAGALAAALRPCVRASRSGRRPPPLHRPAALPARLERTTLQTWPQVSELAGKAEHTRDFAIMPAGVSSSATPNPIVGHDKQTSTITLVLSASNHPQPARASSIPSTTNPHLQPTPGAPKDTAALHATHHPPQPPDHTATAAPPVSASTPAPASGSISAPTGAAPALARTLSAPSSLSSTRDVTIVGKDIPAKLGMRVEMREMALAKARGAGVLTSVSRKGGHSQKCTYIHACLRTCIHTYIHTYMLACIHTYIHIHTYMHKSAGTGIICITHTHTHTHARAHTHRRARVSQVGQRALLL